MTTISRLVKEIKKTKSKITLSLGEFVIQNPPLGQGGNGIVYEATINGKSVALKFLLTDSTGKTKEQKIKRFLSEYFNVVTLSDTSSIVRYIDYDLFKLIDEDGELYIPVIIMTKYESSLTKRQEAKSEGEFISLYNFLIDTIKVIHNEGIIHRDIKPENILVKNNKFYLADFGIASYNPEMFKIVAETEKKERLGNRLFSAPEQEKSGIKAHQTMDIYAIGQVLQWYATGYIHRGTGRQTIVTFYKSLQVYDLIIEKCLEQDPKARFQSIKEIEEYFEKSRKKNVYEYLHLFHRVCIGSFPRNDYRIVHSNNRDKIDFFLELLMRHQDEFDDTLWWVDGNGSFEFTLEQKGKGVWKFWESEYNLTDIWLHYDGSIFNDFALFHFKKGEPFKVEGQERYDTAIVDGKYHISYSEYANGIAEIEGKIVDLSNHSVESIHRQDSEGYFFVGTASSCIIQWENEEEIRNFMQTISFENRQPTIEELKIFERKVRKNKNQEVSMFL